MSRQRSVSRAQKVYGQLIDDISEGRWTAEKTVSSYVLAERLRVSRTPVVEALKRLEAEGVIEIVPKVGARLTRSTPEAREERFALAARLLGLAAERAAGRGGELRLTHMDALLDRLAAAADAGEARPAGLAHELALEVMRAGLPRSASAAARFLAPLHAESGVSSASGLRAIVEALHAGSPRRARAAAEFYVESLQAASRAPEAGRAPTPGLEHAALEYRSNAEFIATALPFVLAGLQRGEPVLMVSQPGNLEALASALGADSGKVDYRDSAQWYDDPSATLRRYRRYIDERSTVSRVRVVGEPVWTGLTASAVEDWLRCESVINVALESAPATLVCAYDAGELPASIIRGAREAHPCRHELGGATPCVEYRGFFATASPRVSDRSA